MTLNSCSNNNITRFFYELLQFRLVVFQLVDLYVTLRYRRTTLGFFWTLINPLVTMTITAVVFSMMMKVSVESFAIFLFTGLIPWTLFSGCMVQGSASIIENESLLKKIYIPRQTFVVSRCLSLFVDSLLSFVALFFLAIILGAHLTWALIFLPISFILVFTFTLGMTLTMSVVSVFYRDTQNVINIALQAGYFLTPIIYPISMVPQHYQWIFKWNPMFYFVELFRQPIYNGVFPSVTVFAIGLGCALSSLFLGIAVFRKFDHLLIYKL